MYKNIDLQIALPFLLFTVLEYVYSMLDLPEIFIFDICGYMYEMYFFHSERILFWYKEI